MGLAVAQALYHKSAFGFTTMAQDKEYPSPPNRTLYMPSLPPLIALASPSPFPPPQHTHTDNSENPKELKRLPRLRVLVLELLYRRIELGTLERPRKVL